jgi:hypothetical protein
VHHSKNCALMSQMCQIRSFGDLAALASAAAPVAGKSSIVFVTHPTQAVAVGLRSLATFAFAVLPSSHVPAKTVIAVASNALASAIGGEPQVDVSQEAVVHSETSPAAIVTPAGTMATPIRSFYQTDSVGLKMKWPISWAETHSAQYWQSMEAAAISLAVQFNRAPAREAAGIESAVAGLAREPNGGVLVMPDAFTLAHRELIVALTAGHRLPTIYPFRAFVDTGGLLSYGIDQVDIYRQAASYVDRILK